MDSSSSPRRPPLRARNRGACLRVSLLGLLLLGLLVRPLLILGCEIHAVRFAHAAHLHEHAHTLPEGDAEPDAHGEHDQLQSGALSSAADLALPVTVPPALRARAALHAFAAPALPHGCSGTPFRPPIG
jgi:hypothetical protein